MSALDLSSMVNLSTPELLAPPEPPATPAIDTSTTSTSDSSSSNGASLNDLSAQQQVESSLLSEMFHETANPYGSPEEQAAAALVDLSGASSITVDDFEASVPPNLAAASRLLDELTAAGSVSMAAMGSLYTLMDSGAALALTQG